MSVYVHICSCVCAHVVYRKGRVSTGSLPQWLSALLFEAGSLAELGPSLFSCTDWQRAPGTHCLSPSWFWSTAAPCCTWLFMWVLGTWTQGLMTAHQAFLWLSHCPSPHFEFWSVSIQVHAFWVKGFFQYKSRHIFTNQGVLLSCPQWLFQGWACDQRRLKGSP